MMVPWIPTRAWCAPAGRALVRGHLLRLRSSSFQSIFLNKRLGARAGLSSAVTC